jgi:uncharacterized protein YecA (UPF0149 family)
VLDPISPTYAGDEAFARLLGDLRCPTPLHQIKTLILGCLAASELPRISDLFDAVWAGQEPVFDSEDQGRAFVANLMGLWNNLTAHQKGTPFRLSPIPLPASTGDVAQYAAVRHAEIQGFIRGLDLGDTDPDTMSPPARKALEALAGGAAFFEQYEQLAREKEEASEAEIQETGASLRKLDEVLENAIGVIIMEQAARQMTRLTSTNGREPLRRPPTPGRNDPCPCGSGLKYKRCCGRH